MLAFRKLSAAVIIAFVTMTISLCSPNAAQAATVSSTPTSISSSVNTAVVTSDAPPNHKTGKHAGKNKGKKLKATNPAARLNYVTKTVGVKGLGWGGPWFGVTLSWSRTRAAAIDYVGKGAGATAVGLCASLVKLPYGTIVAPVCVGYLVGYGGRIVSDLNTARKSDKCVQFRYYPVHFYIHAPTRVVSCVPR